MYRFVLVLHRPFLHKYTWSGCATKAQGLQRIKCWQVERVHSEGQSRKSGMSRRDHQNRDA